MERPHVHLTEITFSGGDVVSLGPNDKVLLVGPNNAGKSKALRDIYALMEKQDKAAAASVVRSVHFDRVGSADELNKFLTENFDRGSSPANSDNISIFGKDFVYLGNLPRIWNESGLYLGGLVHAFLGYIGPEERLRLVAAKSHRGESQPKSQSHHFLYEDKPLLRKVSGVFREAFHADLIIDYLGGDQIVFHVGTRPDETIYGLDPTEKPYSDYVKSLPRLDQQGDGMRSYAGILFETMVNPRDITLLDEPEAFLHPPQMRRLARTLAQQASGQLIVATHSSDILRGFVEGTTGDNLRILRITREGDINHVHEADPATLKELWDKPEFRYSNALDGIFHEQTIICEDDSDCRVYNAMADHDAVTNHVSYPDTSYTPTGGKHRAPKVASVLHKIGVPVRCIFDMDVISEADNLKRIVEAVGGDYSEFEALRDRVDKAVRERHKAPTENEIREKLEKLLMDSEGAALPAEKMREVLRKPSAWRAVKEGGEAVLPRGENRNAFNTLKQALQDIGIFVVPVGELEGFAPHLGKHGPPFVAKFFEEVSLDDEDLHPLRDFVQQSHGAETRPV